MGLINKEQSLDNAVDRLLNPQSEEPTETSEAENPEESEATEVVAQEEEVEVVEDDNQEVEESTEEDEEVVEEEVEEGEVNEEPENQEAYYTVKVGGEEIEVNLQELTDGYQRNKDYTQKTQTLAEDRKDLEAIKGELEAQRTQYIEVNKQLLQREAQALAKFDGIDWATLSVEDPLEYTSKQAEYSEAKRQAQARVEQIQAAMTQEQNAQAGRMQEYLVTQQSELERLLPESKDMEFKNGLAEYAKTVGYTDEDLGQLVRAQDVVTLHKAKLFDELQAAKAKVKEKKGPAKAKTRVKATAPQQKATKKARKVKEKRETLRKSGNLRDAAALLLNN